MKKVLFGTLVLFLLLGGASCVDLEEIDDGTPNCSGYANRPLQYIPVRCFAELHINKGCFQIEEHGAKTKTYTVIPLCNNP